MYIAPAPAVIAAPAFAVEYITTEPALSYVAAAPTVYAAPAPVVEYVRGGVHRARDCRVCDTSTRGRVHRASAIRILCGNSSTCVYCTSTISGAHLASASRFLCDFCYSHVRCASVIGGVRRASANRFLRGYSSGHVQHSQQQVHSCSTLRRRPMFLLSRIEQVPQSQVVRKTGNPRRPTPLMEL